MRPTHYAAIFLIFDFCWWRYQSRHFVLRSFARMQKKEFLENSHQLSSYQLFHYRLFFSSFAQGTPGGCKSCIIPNHIESCLNSQTKNQTKLKYLPSNSDGKHLVYIYIQLIYSITSAVFCALIIGLTQRESHLLRKVSKLR